MAIRRYFPRYTAGPPGAVTVGSIPRRVQTPMNIGDASVEAKIQGLQTQGQNAVKQAMLGVQALQVEREELMTEAQNELRRAQMNESPFTTMGRILNATSSVLNSFGRLAEIQQKLRFAEEKTAINDTLNAIRLEATSMAVNSGPGADWAKVQQDISAYTADKIESVKESGTVTSKLGIEMLTQGGSDIVTDLTLKQLTANTNNRIVSQRKALDNLEVTALQNIQARPEETQKWLATVEERYAVLEDAGVISPEEHIERSRKFLQNVDRNRLQGILASGNRQDVEDVLKILEGGAEAVHRVFPYLDLDEDSLRVLRNQAKAAMTEFENQDKAAFNEFMTSQQIERDDYVDQAQDQVALASSGERPNYGVFSKWAKVLDQLEQANNAQGKDKNRALQRQIAQDRRAIEEFRDATSIAVELRAGSDMANWRWHSPEENRTAVKAFTEHLYNEYGRDAAPAIAKAAGAMEAQLVQFEEARQQDPAAFVPNTGNRQGEARLDYVYQFCQERNIPIKDPLPKANAAAISAALNDPDPQKAAWVAVEIEKRYGRYTSMIINQLKLPAELTSAIWVGSLAEDHPELSGKMVTFIELARLSPTEFNTEDLKRGRDAAQSISDGGFLDLLMSGAENAPTGLSIKLYNGTVEVLARYAIVTARQQGTSDYGAVLRDLFGRINEGAGTFLFDPKANFVIPANVEPRLAKKAVDNFMSMDSLSAKLGRPLDEMHFKVVKAENPEMPDAAARELAKKLTTAKLTQLHAFGEIRNHPLGGYGIYNKATNLFVAEPLIFNDKGEIVNMNKPYLFNWEVLVSGGLSEWLVSPPPDQMIPVPEWARKMTEERR